MPPLMTEDRILEWVKVLGPFVCSWPLVVLAIVITFRKTIAEVVSRIVGRGISEFNLGPAGVKFFEDASKATEQIIAKKSGGEEPPPSESVMSVIIGQLPSEACRYLVYVSGKPYPIEEHQALLRKGSGTPSLISKNELLGDLPEKLFASGYFFGTVTWLSGLLFHFTIDGNSIVITVFPEAMPLLAKRFYDAPPLGPPLTVTGTDTAGADGRPDAPSGRRP